MSFPAAQAAEFTVKAIMGISSGVLRDAGIDATNKINEANAYASNLVRGANNELAAKRGSLARYTQSVNNQRVLENMGGQAEAAQINYRRARDSATQDSFEQQIAFAEQAGAQAAAGALSGLTGGVADIVAGTTALRKARTDARVAAATKAMDFDSAQRVKNIMQAGWDSLDHSEVTDALDYSTDVAVKQASGGNLFADILGQQDPRTLANVSSNLFSKSYDAFADRAGPAGSGSAGRTRTITGGR